MGSMVLCNLFAAACKDAIARAHLCQNSNRGSKPRQHPVQNTLPLQPHGQWRAVPLPLPSTFRAAPVFSLASAGQYERPFHSNPIYRQIAVVSSGRPVCSRGHQDDYAANCKVTSRFGKGLASRWCKHQRPSTAAPCSNTTSTGMFASARRCRSAARSGRTMPNSASIFCVPA